LSYIPEESSTITLQNITIPTTSRGSIGYVKVARGDGRGVDLRRLALLGGIEGKDCAFGTDGEWGEGRMEGSRAYASESG